MFVSFNKALEIGKSYGVFSHEPDVYGPWADLMLVLATCDQAAGLGWEDVTRCVVTMPDWELVPVSVEPQDLLRVRVGLEILPMEYGESDVCGLYGRLRQAQWLLSDESAEFARSQG